MVLEGPSGQTAQEPGTKKRPRLPASTCYCQARLLLIPGSCSTASVSLNLEILTHGS